MTALVHLLTPAADLRHCVVACGAADVAYGTWITAQVTCPACRGARAPCTCSPTTPLCAVCQAWQRTHRADGSRRQTPLLPTFKTEKDWLTYLRQTAREAGFLTYHTLHSHGSEPGFPDLVLAKPHQTLYMIEAKTQTGRVSPQQQHWMETLQTVKQVAADIWRPSDLPEILEIFSS